ncbi:MAG TPA: VOC family protein [Chryseosolibacter sp.]
MNISQIKETCIYCRDLEKAKAFYEGVLGLGVINYLPGKHLFLRAGNSVLLIFNPDDSRTKKSPPAHFANGRQHFAFEVKPELYDSHKEEVQGRGIVIIDTLVWKNGQESFYFNDPEGNVLEIVPEGIWD